jgi:hypothetical protein
MSNESASLVDLAIAVENLAKRLEADVAPCPAAGRAALSLWLRKQLTELAATPK